MVPLPLPVPDVWGELSPVFVVVEPLVKLGLAPTGKSHSTVGAPPMTGPQEYWALGCPHGASSKSSIKVQVFLLQPWFPSWLLLTILCSNTPWLPVSARLSLQSWGEWFALCPPRTFGSKKSCWFSVCSTFYLLLEHSDNFQAPSMRNSKLEVSSNFFLSPVPDNIWSIFVEAL